MVKRGDLRKELSEACLRQSVVAEAGAVFVIAAVFERTTGKYGARAERYVNQEVGCAAQNIALQAVSLGLGTCMVGAYDDARVARTAGLAKNEAPLVILPVGKPSGRA